MDCIFSGLQYETVIVYLDDLIVFGSDYDEHLQYLEEVLKRLSKANLKFSPLKCYFLKLKVEYLGHVVSHGEIRPDPSKVSWIKEWPRPSTVKELRSFLGIASYYRRFIKNFTQISSPLIRLLEKTVDFVWNEDCERSFSTLKRLLAEDVTVAFPDFTRPFRVATDAISTVVGAVLSQIQTDGRERSISFIIEREAYAIIWAFN